MQFCFIIFVLCFISLQVAHFCATKTVRRWRKIFMDGTTQQVTLCFVKRQRKIIFFCALNFFNLRFRLKFRRIFLVLFSFGCKLLLLTTRRKRRRGHKRRQKQLKHHFQERTLSIARAKFCDFLTPVLHFYERSTNETAHTIQVENDSWCLHM